MGLPQNLRIKKKVDFELSRRVGLPHHRRHFLWVFVPSDEPPAKLGLAVTKKLFPKAVDRNRIKRVVREVFRKNPQFIPKGYNVVVVAKGLALEANYNVCLRELKSIKLRQLRTSSRKRS